MDIESFRKILATFSDPGTQPEIQGADIVVSVNDDLLQATVSLDAGDVFLRENDAFLSASQWITQRLARLPLLATRLLEQTPETEFFVPPSGRLLPSLETGPAGEAQSTDNALQSVLESLDNRSPLETTVLYITSDAGEGKTSLINQLTRAQAQRFRDGKSKYLVVPISLGGRHFLRFDDITVGALQNRYRFPFLYYNSFLALVRMGVLIPAYDGFEEMFVENSSGEALSAMAILIDSLRSMGALVVAARKAYFEFENLKIQDRFYETIHDHSVGFAKLELQRWSDRHFMQYCENRGVGDPSRLHGRIRERLGEKHPMLTRPVLVKRLIDIAMAMPSIDDFLGKVSASGADYFAVFVERIVEREASEKWLDRSGEVAVPLLTTAEHCDLLSQIALAMWDSRVDFIKRDHIEFVADYFCDSAHKRSHVAQQVKERIRGHALLVVSKDVFNALEFDHEEFRLFFLGEAIAKQLAPCTDRARVETMNSLRKGALPAHARDALIRSITRDDSRNHLPVVKSLLSICSIDGQSSYTHENCASILIRLLHDLDSSGLFVENIAFGPNSLRGRSISGVHFVKCYFSSSSLELTKLVNCRFDDCRFAQLSFYENTSVSDVEFRKCTVDAIKEPESSRDTWDPTEIAMALSRLGVRMDESSQAELQYWPQETSTEPDLHDVERIARYFSRSTHISESVIRLKLGARASHFLDESMPRLLSAGIVVEIVNRGSGGEQRRFKLARTPQSVSELISESSGSFETFLSKCSPVEAEERKRRL